MKEKSTKGCLASSNMKIRYKSLTNLQHGIVWKQPLVYIRKCIYNKRGLTNLWKEGD